MKREARLAVLKAGYEDNRQSLYAYAAAVAGKNAADAIAAAVAAELRHAGRLVSAVDSNYILLRALDRAARRTEYAEPANGLGGLTALPIDVRRAWTLRRLCGLSSAQTAKLMGTDRDGVAALVAKGGELDEVEVRTAVKSFAAGADAWNQIEFLSDKSTVRARRMRNGVLAVLGVAVIAVLVREAVAAVKIISVAREAEPSAALTASTDISQHWTEHDYVQADGLNMDAELFSRLSALDGDAAVRLDFTYYDAELVRSVVTEDGRNLYDIYDSLYNESSQLSTAYAMCCAAVNRYYAGYEFDAAKSPIFGHRSGFEPAYDSYYGALLDIAGGRNAEIWATLSAAYPDMFASETVFDGFLFSQAFLYHCPGLTYTLEGEYRHRQWLKGENLYAADEDPEMLYEYVLYSFYNNYGGQYRYKELFTYPDDELKRFSADLAVLGEAVEEALCAAVDGYGLDDLQSERFDYADCSYFSAYMTASRAIELAADGRFTFKGLAYPDAPDGYPERLETRLAMRLAYGESERLRVYYVDDDFYEFSRNYLVPLNLPERFRAEVNASMTASRGGALAFESDVGYNYKAYYGHERDWGRYAMLRALFLEPEARVVWSDGHSFMRLS